MRAEAVASGPPAEHPGIPADQTGPTRPEGRTLFLASVVVALLPIVVATGRAVTDRWLPIGDNAYFAIRSFDVFTRHTPLLGTWTSASLSVGHAVNNPGPLLWDLLAVPVRVLGTAAGLAVGVALLNAAAVVGIALGAWRRGGALLGTLAMLVTALLCLSMGSELLFDPWQPHSLVLPFLCFLVLAWGMACGDLVLVPWAVGVASLLVETHLTYVYLVPALAVWAAIGWALGLRSRAPAERRAELRRARAWVGVGALVAVVCWLPPLAEEISNGSDGNLSRLVRAIGAGKGATVSAANALRIMSTVLGVPPFWLRPSFHDAFVGVPPSVRRGEAGFGIDYLPALPTALVTLTVLVAVLGGCAWLARRDPVTSRCVTTAGVALVGAWLTITSIPAGVLGVAPHQLRFLWPLGAFTAFAVGATLLRSTRRPRAAFVVVLAGATGVAATLNLPTYNAQSGPSAYEWSIPVMRDVDRQLVSVRGPVLYDFSGTVFAEPYSTAIMAELQRRGVEFVVLDPTQVRQLGPGRRYDGRNARARIFYALGDSARRPPPGARTVAYHGSLTAAERRERAALEVQVVARLRAGGARLDPAALARTVGRLRTLDGLPGPIDPGPALASGELVYAVRHDVLVLDRPWRRVFARWAELRQRGDDRTIGVFVLPIDESTRAKASR